jgi:tetratricopeptide (TPR) repeat protein
MKTLVKYLIPFLIVSLLPDSGFGQQTLEFMGRGEYVMGDGETPAVAEERAVKIAERDAAEQAGVFIKSSTLVKDQTVVEDVIETVANQSMSVQVLEKKRIPLSGRDKSAGEIETLNIEENLKKTGENSQLVDVHRKLKEEYENQAKEMEKLKKRLALVDTGHRQETVKKIALEEKRFEAARLVEKGELAAERSDMMAAMESFTSALSLYPEFAYAYGARGAVYLMLNENDKARADMQKAIDLDPKGAFYYAGRAATYRGCTESTPLPCKQALKDVNAAIRLQPDSAEFYLIRAGIYFEANNNEKAIEDLTKAADTDRNAFWPSNAALAYAMKDQLMKDGKNDLYSILADMTAAISITTNSKYYREVLKPISEVTSDLRKKKITEKQAQEVLTKKIHLDLANPKDEKRMYARTDNLNFISALYARRADIYTKLGYRDKAEADLKAACGVIWNEETCKAPSTSPEK